MSARRMQERAYRLAATLRDAGALPTSPRTPEPAPSPWLALGAIVAVVVYVVALLWLAWHLAGPL
jgi:hypothetical protein